MDIHVHSSPDIAPRSSDDLATVRAADAARMGVLVLKSHHTLTSTRAYLCTQALQPTVRVHGGLALNSCRWPESQCRGNPRLAFGRVISMPTYGAQRGPRPTACRLGTRIRAF